MNNKKI